MSRDPCESFQAMKSLLARLPASARGGMLGMYRQSLLDYLVLAQTCLQPGGDMDALRQVLHRLAGASGMMQDLCLSDAARTMETALREDREADARAAWPQVLACADATRRAVEDILATS